MTGKNKRISDLLLLGTENAIPLGHLARATGIDPRTIRRMIWQERKQGAPICCDNRTGYFLAASEAEKARCVRSLRHRAAEIFGTADAVEKAEIAPDKEVS